MFEVTKAETNAYCTEITLTRNQDAILLEHYSDTGITFLTSREMNAYPDDIEMVDMDRDELRVLRDVINEILEK